MDLNSYSYSYSYLESRLQQTNERVSNAETALQTHSGRLDKTDQEVTILEKSVNILESTLTNLINTLSSIPPTLKQKSKDMTDYLSNKIEEYRKTIKGDEQDSNGEMVHVKELHAELLDRLRKDNPVMYCIVVQAADCLTQPTTQQTYLKCNNNVYQCFSVDPSYPNQAIVYIANLLLIEKYASSNNVTFIPSQNQLSSLQTHRDTFKSREEIAQWFNSAKP